MKYSVLNRTNKCSHRLARIAREAVTLTGLDSDLFNEAVTNCTNIHHDLFQECFPEDKLLRWRTDTSADHFVLHMHSCSLKPVTVVILEAFQSDKFFDSA